MKTQQGERNKKIFTILYGVDIAIIIGIIPTIPRTPSLYSEIFIVLICIRYIIYQIIYTRNTTHLWLVPILTLAALTLRNHPQSMWVHDYPIIRTLSNYANQIIQLKWSWIAFSIWLYIIPTIAILTQIKRVSRH